MAWEIDINETSLDLKYRNLYKGPDTAILTPSGHWKIEGFSITSRSSLLLALIPLAPLAIWLKTTIVELEPSKNVYNEMLNSPSFWLSSVPIVAIVSHVILIYIKNKTHRDFMLSRSIEIPHEYLCPGRTERIAYLQEFTSHIRAIRKGTLKASMACIESREVGDVNSSSLLWETNLEPKLIEQDENIVQGVWDVDIPNHLPASIIENTRRITWKLRVKIEIPGQYSDTYVFTLPVAPPKAST